MLHVIPNMEYREKETRTTVLKHKKYMQEILRWTDLWSYNEHNETSFSN